ncbi:hypothetical protein [Tenacibaculum ovolyticum]
MNCNTPCLPTDCLVVEQKKKHKVSTKKIKKWFLPYIIFGAKDLSRFK